MQRATIVLLSMSLGLGSSLGCGDHEPGMPTARTYDVRPVIDAGLPDADGAADAGLTDADISADAAAPDATAPADASTESDAGVDAGIDASIPVGLPDAATSIDAGVVDATIPDASVAVPHWVVADTLVAATVRAGDALLVTCLLEDAAHQRIVAPATQTSSITVLPASAATTREDGTLVPTRAGDLTVGCAFPALGLADATPATVKVLPGVAAKVVASADRGSIEAGQSVAVSCAVVDAFDNPLMGLAPIVRAVPYDVKNTVQAMLATFERAGAFQIHCDLGGATSVPVQLEVRPALPASLVMAKVPDRVTYSIGEVVEVTRVVTDRYGNSITNVSVPVVSDPAGTQAGDGRFSYAKAGSYRLTATVTPPTEGGVVLSKSVDVLVDATGPSVNCDYPLDREILDRSPSGALVFRGTVTDPSGVKDVRVNGVSRTVDQAGHFTAELTSRFGHNFVDLVAEDTNGRKTKRLCSFLMANQWVTDGSYLDGGLSFWLRQLAVDDSDRSDLDALGDVLEAALNSSGLRDAIHSMLGANSVLKSGCDQTLLGRCVLSSQVTYQDTRILGPSGTRLALVNNGLASTTRIGNLGVELRLDANLAGLTYQNVGWINFEYIDVSTTFDLTIANGRPKVTVRPGATATSVGPISVDLSGTEGNILAILVDLANGLLREYVAMRVQAFVTENVGSVLDGVVGSLDPSALGSTTAVARFDGTGVIPLNIAVEFSSLATDSRRMRFAMGTRFTVPPLATKPAIGAPLAETVRALELASVEPMGMAIHEAILNQGLYTLWRAGYFDVKVNDKTPGLNLTPGLAISLVAELPPVAVVKGTRVELSLGGIAAQMTYGSAFPAPIPIALGARASMAIHRQGNSLAFDGFTLDETHLAMDAPDLDPMIRSLLEGAIPSMLEGVVSDALRNAAPSVPVPSFTLPSSVATFGLPAGAHFGMQAPRLVVQTPAVYLLGQPAFW